MKYLNLNYYLWFVYSLEREALSSNVTFTQRSLRLNVSVEKRLSWALRRLLCALRSSTMTWDILVWQEVFSEFGHLCVFKKNYIFFSYSRFGVTSKMIIRVSINLLKQKNFFEWLQIQVLSWLAKSPDLNPVENSFADITR